MTSAVRRLNAAAGHCPLLPLFNPSPGAEGLQPDGKVWSGDEGIATQHSLYTPHRARQISGGEGHMAETVKTVGFRRQEWVCSRAYPVPYPPPPGVAMPMRSPFRAENVTFPGKMR